nr:DNA/RNA non-specific endonuclease [Sansalvadorimonas sp. 2012CJ34-2]
MAVFLWEDEPSQALITQFAKDYARAQHSLEVAELAGSAAFEVLLTIVLIVATGGTGAVASLASKPRLVGRFQKVGKLFERIVDLKPGKKRPGRPQAWQTRESTGSSQLKSYETEGKPHQPSDPPKSKKPPKRTKVTKTYGSNKATWTLDESGRPISVEAKLDSTYNSPRSADEKGIQRTIGGDERLPDDDGGHIVGHRFMSDQGEKNLFPQNSNLNRSAYKKMENEWADWTSEGFEVQLKVDLHPPGSERPTDIVAKYSVINPRTGKPVFKRRERFNNSAGETFERVTKSDMRSYR